MSKVLKYKIEKYLLNDEAEKTPAGIAKAIGRVGEEYEIEKILAETRPELLPRTSIFLPPRTDATIDELIEYIKPGIEKYGIQYIIDYSWHSSACGCMGPQNNDPLCPCRMNSEVYRRKTDILIAITARQQCP